MSLNYKDPTAWMIKNDGLEIPVITHVYADKGEIDELLALVYFLWEYDTGSRQTIGEFLNVWALDALANHLSSRIFVKDEVICSVKEYVSSKPYIIFPQEFAEVIADNSTPLKKRGRGEHVVKQPVDGADLIDTLNQRFLRARYGGRYNTVKGCCDIFFRVSSVGFDWFAIIRDFVKKRSNTIETVTIVRDFESTGCEKYYTDSTNHPYNEMSISDFLKGSGSTQPVISPHKKGLTSIVAQVLTEGGSAQQLRQLPANYTRIQDAIKRLKHEEEKALINE